MKLPKPTSLQHGVLALVLALSLVLRVTQLDVFLTSDEDQWYVRSLKFRTALLQRDWKSTYQTGHPGVLTMWVGAAAEQFRLLTQPNAQDGYNWLLKGETPLPGAGVLPLTRDARFLVAVISWLSILALFPMLRRLFGSQVALLGMGLVALDPFFLAHSRLHHLDALLTTFTTLSVVCLLAYQFDGRRIGYLLASAAAAGLAVASKSPGVILAPWAALVLVAPPLLGSSTERWRELRRSILGLALWGIVAALVLVAVWPAMWVSPWATLQNVLQAARHYAERPHENRNFFWFRVCEDPGPAFYPLAWAFRTTPWVLLGLPLLALARRDRARNLPLLLLCVAALAFAVVMTGGAKKFDRYLLPVFPLLDIVAAVGWMALLRRLSSRLAPHWRCAAPGLLSAFLIGTHLIWLWPTRPYYVSYYNPALGGGRTAPSVLLVGWGEGSEQAAAYLNQEPDAAQLRVGSWPRLEFRCFFKGDTLSDTARNSLAEVDYVVFYRSLLQRDRVSVAPLFMGVRQPEHLVRLNGIDYVWIYRNTVYDQAQSEILAQIASRADPQQDLILLDVRATFARHYTGTVPLEIVACSDRLDAVQLALQRAVGGHKRIWHLVYPDSIGDVSAKIADQLQQQATVGGEIVAGDLRAVRYDLVAHPRFVPAQPTTPSGVRFGEHIVLVGYDAPDTELEPGQPLHIRFHWQADAQLAQNSVVFVHLIGPDNAKYGQTDAAPQDWMLPTSIWRPGERIPDDHVLDVSPLAPAGSYVVVIGMYDSETHKRLPVFDPAGNRLPDDVLILDGYTVTDHSTS